MTMKDLAPTLIAAGISEDRLQHDLETKAQSPAVQEIEVPAHQKQCCYEHLLRGDTVEQAASVAIIPVTLAQKIADEIDACCTKLGSTSPVKKKPKQEAEGSGGAVVSDPVKGKGG